MKIKLPTILFCLLIGYLLMVSTYDIYVGVGGSLIAAGILLIIDVIFSMVYKYSPLEQILYLRRVKIYDDNAKAFNDICNKYNGEIIQEAIFVGYTADMEARNLQIYAGDNNITIENLKILIKNPHTLSNTININNIIYKGFPGTPEKISNRKSEIIHSINEIKGLKGNFVRNFEVRFYYSLPSIRAILLDNEFGFISLYKRHTTGDDLSGTTDLYIRISKLNEFEKKLLNNFLEWFKLIWNLNKPLK